MQKRLVERLGLLPRGEVASAGEDLQPRAWDGAGEIGGVVALDELVVGAGGDHDRGACDHAEFSRRVVRFGAQHSFGGGV